MGVVGLFAFVGIAYLFSTDRKKINWKLVGWGIFIQIVFAIIILPDSFLNEAIKDLFSLGEAPGAMVFSKLNGGVKKLLSFSEAGSDFLTFSNSLGSVAPGFDNFIFKVLPTIPFFSGIMAILYHLGIIQFVVKRIANVMAKTMKTSGAESLSAAANIFVGQTEAPLVIKPFVERMTESELLAIMTGGMATVSGGIMASYVAFLGARIPDIAGHLIAASVMSAPAALVIAKILIPETGKPATFGNTDLDIPKTSSNVIEAAANGALDGLKLALNVAAMLLVFVALVSMFNYFISKGGEAMGMPYLTMEWLLGKIMTPLAFIMGVRWEDTAIIGSLLGKKTILNEFVAFYDLSIIVNSPAYFKGLISPKSVLIATYALCGFSNFSSIAIQIGGIGSIAPSRQKDLARLGMRALLAGSFACFMTACIAGVLMPSTNKSKTLGMAQTTNSAEPTLIAASFHKLRTDLTNDASPDIKQKIWLAARNQLVQWKGQIYKIENNNSVIMYFGFKDAASLNGNESYEYATISLKTLPEKIRISTSKSSKLISWDKVSAGDTIQIKGKLVETQVSNSILFRVENAMVVNIK